MKGIHRSLGAWCLRTLPACACATALLVSTQTARSQADSHRDDV